VPDFSNKTDRNLDILDGAVDRFAVEVLGRYSNLVDQGERVSYLLQIVPSGPSEAKTRTPKRVCRRLDPAQVEQLVARYAEGVPVADLAATFGIDQWTVQKYARRHGLPRRSPRLGPVQTAEATRLYLAGQSLAKLSDHFGVATDTVAAALRRAGVTLRPRRGWSTTKNRQQPTHTLRSATETRSSDS
jgi:hypothetical protein